jgi:hypothetical protein
MYSIHVRQCVTVAEAVASHCYSAAYSAVTATEVLLYAAADVVLAALTALTALKHYVW